MVYENYGGTPPIVISSSTSMVPSQLNSRLGFINPGLTLIQGTLLLLYGIIIFILGLYTIIYSG